MIRFACFGVAFVEANKLSTSLSLVKLDWLLVDWPKHVLGMLVKI